MELRKRALPAVLAVYLLCYGFRVWEYFVLRTDQTVWGEAFVHKLIGIAVLCAAVKWLSLSFEGIGLTREGIASGWVKGLLFGAAAFAVAYGAEALLAAARGSFQGLELYVSAYSVDGNAGKRTELAFFMICIAGNVINAVMEEGLFRGLFQRALQGRYSFITSAVIAACLFGLWHVIGPIRSYCDGTSSLGGAAANMAMLAVTSGLVGFKLAMMARLTGSLYMAMGDHFANNAIVNLLHVVSGTGADELMAIRIAIAQTLSFLAVLVWYLRRRAGKAVTNL